MKALKFIGTVLLFPFTLIGFVIFLFIYWLCKSEGLSHEDAVDIARLR